MRNLWKSWTWAERLLRKHPKILLLLDFDGTLAPLARHPDRVRLPEAMRRLLSGLCGMPDVGVAIWSGRSMKYLKSRFRMPGLYYGGNHGLEILGPGLFFRHPRALRAVPHLQTMKERLKQDFKQIPGALIEYKGFAVSLHYRNVPAERRLFFDEKLIQVREQTRDWPLSWLPGKKVWEIMPQVRWGKGRAALFLLRYLGFPYPVAVGDDRTDEDMFEALKDRGLTIRVGPAMASLAQFSVDRQPDVHRILESIGRLRAKPLYNVR